MEIESKPKLPKPRVFCSIALIICFVSARKQRHHRHTLRRFASRAVAFVTVDVDDVITHPLNQRAVRRRLDSIGGLFVSRKEGKTTKPRSKQNVMLYM